MSQRGKRSENGDTSNDDNKSALGDKTLSALSKQFRGFLGPAKSNANYKVEKKDDRIDDGELSALSKAFRNFLPLGAPQKKEESKGIADDELSALSKQYRPFLKPISTGAKSNAQYPVVKENGGLKKIIADDELSALSKQFR